MRVLPELPHSIRRVFVRDWIVRLRLRFPIGPGVEWLGHPEKGHEQVFPQARGIDLEGLYFHALPRAQAFAGALACRRWPRGSGARR